jgi:hypothetical protein
MLFWQYSEARGWLGSVGARIVRFVFKSESKKNFVAVWLRSFGPPTWFGATVVELVQFNRTHLSQKSTSLSVLAIS